MKKSTLFLIAILISTHTLKSQNYFEELPFPDSTNIYNLAFSQQGDIFAAVHSLKVTPNSGVYKSSDSGQTWNMILSSDHGTNDIDLNEEGDLYALYGWAFLEESLVKSLDNGQTWNGIYVPLEIGWFNTGLFIQGIDTLFIAQNAGSFTRLLRSINDGISWDTVFYRTDYSSETIGDLAFGHNGEIFMAISGFMEGNGGLFKSVDSGNTWTLFGLQGNMVYDISYNSNGDLIIASLGGQDQGGLYAVFQGDNTITPISLGVRVASVVVNSSDDIFAGNFDHGAVYHSSDNGTSYEWLNSGMNYYAHIEKLNIDQQQFIYGVSPTHLIYRSVQSTITSSTIIERTNILQIFPNPCNETIQGHIDNGYNGNIEYEVYNLEGEKSLRGLININNGDFRIDSSSLKPGMYYIILNARVLNSSKFIKL